MSRKYTKEFLDTVELEHVREIDSLLSRSFVWDFSPQGHDAWSNVVDALREIEAAKRREKPE